MSKIIILEIGKQFNGEFMQDLQPTIMYGWEITPIDITKDNELHVKVKPVDSNETSNINLLMDTYFERGTVYAEVDTGDFAWQINTVWASTYMTKALNEITSAFRRNRLSNEWRVWWDFDKDLVTPYLCIKFNDNTTHQAIMDIVSKTMVKDWYFTVTPISSGEALTICPNMGIGQRAHEKS